jgi:hypothetical protein
LWWCGAPPFSIGCATTKFSIGGATTTLLHGRVVRRTTKMKNILRTLPKPDMLNWAVITASGLEPVAAAKLSLRGANNWIA